ncbi:putative cytokinetic ring protein SteA [Alkaliphilus oremlandii]|uniref:Thiamin pyrophosphokinase catalytic region n=1 Tax=Alkaliphilus oremlandii (strain OhILAs) TaxID=350688 RepID=A8MFI0_ALKOO|nr:putative cytokinetic ring protein SteA [Alkaliphilus oremlandii]ABW19143.1 Thiamin pyrophosphokinase catalytic region [Alkaliphilus oremlandii OhILAs]
MGIKAKARLDKKTKQLINRLEAGDIAIIDHDDIDEVAANSLVEKKVSAIINCGKSISGRYPNLGPTIISESNIPIFDVTQGNLFELLKEGDIIEIVDDNVIINHQIICEMVFLSKEKIETALALAEKNIEVELEKFIENTLVYANKEKGLILGNLNIPPIKTKMEKKHVLVVVRGQNYREDLMTILSYIKEVRPVLIGVDGGGDALLEFGFIPDIIVGDMDSVSDDCLKKCKEIIVHGYLDGTAPGMGRIENLGLSGLVFSAAGTSEDIAMLIAYDKGADLIVAVGTHSNMIDFLEKGRKGMSSTFLVRMKVGSKLVDARGVSKLYKNNIKPKYIILLVIAALIPITMVMLISKPIQNLFKLLNIRIRMILGL